MKFQFKAIAAAVALAAVAGHAAAAIQPGTDPVTAPNSELVFFAYGFDANGNAATYVKDLGVTFNTFAATPSYTAANLSSDANWNAFLGAGLTGNSWGVFAVNRAPGTLTAANTYKVMTTLTGNTTDGVPALSNANLTSMVNNINQSLASINAGSTAYGTNSSYFYDGSITSDANLGLSLGSNYNTDFTGATNPFAWTRLEFYTLSRGAGSNAQGKPSVADVDTGVNYVWELQGNQLAYVVSVPEPESYAMFLAGLGVIGAMVRRRTQA